MTSIKWIVAIACLVIVHAAPDDPGPQVFEQDSSSSPLNNQRGFVMKEVTLYLTPSQIRALEASKDKDNQQSGAQRFSEQEIQKLEEEIKTQLEQQHIYINDQNSIQKAVPNFYNQPPPPVKEPSNEEPLEYLPGYQQKWTPIPKTEEDQKYFSPVGEFDHQNPSTKYPESYSFVKIYTDDKVHETPKLQLFHPIPHQHYDNDALSKLFEVQRNPLHSKEYKLIPYEYYPDYTPGAPQPDEVKELTKWVTKLDKYESPNNVKTFRNPQITEEPKDQDEKIQKNTFDYHKEESHLKYAPNYDEQKHAAEYQKFVIRLEKENALARAEAVLKSPSVIHHKVITKRRPSFGNKPISTAGPEKSPILRHVWKH